MLFVYYRASSKNVRIYTLCPRLYLRELWFLKWGTFGNDFFLNYANSNKSVDELWSSKIDTKPVLLVVLKKLLIESDTV